MALRDVEWCSTNQALIKAVVFSAAKEELTFKCPLFGTTHSMSPIRIVDGVDCRYFRYRGYKYFLAKTYSDEWKCFFWTLGYRFNSNGREIFKKIILLNDDKKTLIRLTFGGEPIGFLQEEDDGEKSQEE